MSCFLKLYLRGAETKGDRLSSLFSILSLRRIASTAGLPARLRGLRKRGRRRQVLPQREVEEVSCQLQKAKEVKSTLDVEVRFLRKRANMLKEVAFTRSMRMMSDMYFPKDTMAGSSLFITPSFAPATHMPVDSTRSYGAQTQGVAQVAPKCKTVTGVLKKAPNEKMAPSSIQQSKRSGKRKISWQDDYLVKA